MKPDCTLRAYY